MIQQSGRGLFFSLRLWELWKLCCNPESWMFSQQFRVSFVTFTSHNVPNISKGDESRTLLSRSYAVGICAECGLASTPSQMILNCVLITSWMVVQIWSVFHRSWRRFWFWFLSNFLSARSSIDCLLWTFGVHRRSVAQPMQ